MKELVRLWLIFFLLSEMPMMAADETKAAHGVLERTLGQVMARRVNLRMLPVESSGDTYRYHAENGMLYVEATSTAALCRGVYDYLRAERLGTVGWAGSRLMLPNKWPDAELTACVSPFKMRHCYNAVTPGYTTPYWDWARWERELDWLVMHGFNMVMAPVATEAIEEKVWKEMGLTDAEVADFDTGPAHLPWLRMGCIQNVGGDLTESWHRDQIQLQKKLLARMRELGIEPVIQGFAGFVPKGMKRVHPEVTYHETLWNAGFSVNNRPVVMLPDAPLWTEIMNRFISNWKITFGDAKYWLVDSFNELQLPKTDEPPANLLARYGKATFAAIRSADSDAVWVLQGWMFNYQRNIWNQETVKALVESVPENDLLVLDYANDYNPNWDDFSAFHGRSWMMGYVPNMGGKTAYTGRMDFYAKQAAATLANKKRGNLVGFTISGEGLENNEVLYELMSDTAWSSKPVDLNQWLQVYVANRYGGVYPELVEAWQELRASVYSSFTAHPSFGWQKMQLGYGSVYRNVKFPEAVKRFLSQASRLDHMPNYRDDAVEMAALVLGLRADDWFVCARDAHSVGDELLAKQAAEEGFELLLKADRLLESHSYLRLDRWLKFAHLHDGSDAEKDDWERNARRLITTWGPPVNDYSCRVWSGLIRDFYVPRMRAMMDAMQLGRSFNRHAWEAAWVQSLGVSTVERLPKPTLQAAAWVEEAYAKKLPDLGGSEGETLGTWDPSRIRTEWQSLEWPLTREQLDGLTGVSFRFTGGNHRIVMREVAVVADGKVIASDRHDGSAGDEHHGNVYRFNIPKDFQSNNTCVLRAEIKSEVGNSSRGKLFALKEYRKKL